MYKKTIDLRMDDEPVMKTFYFAVVGKDKYKLSNYIKNTQPTLSMDNMGDMFDFIDDILSYISYEKVDGRLVKLQHGYEYETLFDTLINDGPGFEELIKQVLIDAGISEADINDARDKTKRALKSK